MRRITGKTLTKPSSKANQLPSGSSLAILIFGSAIIAFVIISSFFSGGETPDFATPPEGFDPNAPIEITTTTEATTTTTEPVEETTTTVPETSPVDAVPVEIFGNTAVGFPEEAKQALYDNAEPNASTPIVKIELIDWFDTRIAAQVITEDGQRIPVSLTIAEDGTWVPSE